MSGTFVTVVILAIVGWFCGFNFDGALTGSMVVFGLFSYGLLTVVAEQDRDAAKHRAEQREQERREAYERSPEGRRRAWEKRQREKEREKAEKAKSDHLWETKGKYEFQRWLESDD